MKKWLKFFALSFFSHKEAKNGAKRSFANVFLGFILVLVFVWASFIGGDMLPFSVHYDNSPEFMEVAHAVLASPEEGKGIIAVIENGDLRVKGTDGAYAEGLLINTLSREADKENYSINGYEVVVDLRSADTLAEVYAYCVSNDGKETEISYSDYLTLSEVARLNFDFKLRYTGNELVLTDEAVSGYREYLESSPDADKAAIDKLTSELSMGRISDAQYKRGIYELYFSSYYPGINEYESSSAVPLLRNYYYHNYIKRGAEKYLFLFDDYMTASFGTKGGIGVQFYGFYNGLKDGRIIPDGSAPEEAYAASDAFIKEAFYANRFLNAYAYAMNTVTLAPFIALMLLVATLLCYSLLKLGGVERIASLGAMLKIVGSFSWFSGAVSAVCSVIVMFFAARSLITALPLVIFFAVLVIRSLIFVIKEKKLYAESSERKMDAQEEV